MRRRISLYIAGNRADLNDDGLVLMNYAVTDLTNPSVMKNSYSQSVELPRTAVNNIIFGESFRLDRRAGIGGAAADFNASRKTPFAIYNEMDEVLVSGYCKLTSVTKDAYKVSLFGGMGELLHNLSFGDDGEQLSLASLDFGGGDTELDFSITAAKVQAAWGCLSTPYGTQITKKSTLTDKILKENGVTQSVGASYGYYIDVYDVLPGESYDVLGRRFNVADRAVVALFDKDGVFVKQFGTTDTYGWRTYNVAVPDNAVTMYVQGAGDTPGATSVKRVEGKWDIINFAPCYNGIPENFDAGKALADPSDIGLPASITEGGITYGPSVAGHTLITLPEAIDEWAAKDLRSYLQRPVIKFWKILEAIANPANNGGWSIDLSDIDNTTKFPYKEVWLTRPLLPSLGGFKRIDSAVAVTQQAIGWTLNPLVAEFDIDPVAPGTDVLAKLALKPQMKLNSTPSESVLYSYNRGADSEGYAGWWQVVTFIQAVGYDANNTKVAASKTRILTYDTNISPESYASYLGYTPDPMNTAYNNPIRDTAYNKVSGNIFERDSAVDIEIEGINMERIVVNMVAYSLFVGDLGRIHRGIDSGTPAISLQPIDLSNLYVVTDVDLDGMTASASIRGAETLRSGAAITKQLLLSGSQTPAAYLISFCRMFGLYILADSHAKTAKILRRSSFYLNETIDLTRRVDTSADMEIQPVGFDARWYDFKLAIAGGAFADEYKRMTGRQYGSMRVDTNYEFDSDDKDVLDKAVFRQVVPVCDHGPYWNYIVNGGVFSPSPFLTPGGQFTLWDSAGNNLESSLPQPDTTGLVWYNSSNNGYDIVRSRPEFRNKDNKPVDGSDVLLFYNGSYNMKHFRVTDDVADMDTINGGVPCWLLGPDDDGVDVPEFNNYAHLGQDADLSLDFARSRQYDMPVDVLDINEFLYYLAWSTYISDRLSVHGKVLRCRVDLDGLRVGPELLRRFFWYRGSIWALNSIKNYSLTTFDLAECEFVQVQSIASYRTQFI